MNLHKLIFISAVYLCWMNAFSNNVPVDSLSHELGKSDISSIEQADINTQLATNYFERGDFPTALDHEKKH